MVDLFAGPGGWSEGLRMIGLSDVGLEWDRDACRTRVAAGHATIRADVSQYPVEPFVGRAWGLIASPPCTAFSMAGKELGRAEIAHLHEAVEACRDGWVAPEREWLDATTPLVLEPLRWAWALRDSLEWVACEQVPQVLELWKHMADVLRGWGFDATAVKLHAEQYGVPQTRSRAFLLAHRTRARVPEPTHQKYRPGEAAGEGAECRPTLFGLRCLPWVSMAEALGWGATALPYPTIASSRATGGPDKEKVGGSRDRARIYVEQRDGRWLLNPGQTPTQPNRRLYDLDEPAPTVCFGHDANNWRWQLKDGTHDHDVARDESEPAPTLRFGERLNGVDWVRERPATSIVGSFSPDVVTPPGHRDWSESGASRQDSDGAVRIQIHEAAILQSFPADYPFQGSKSSRFSQIGNAVPPRLAAAVIGALTGLIVEAQAAA